MPRWTIAAPPPILARSSPSFPRKRESRGGAPPRSSPFSTRIIPALYPRHPRFLPLSSPRSTPVIPAKAGIQRRRTPSGRPPSAIRRRAPCQNQDFQDSPSAPISANQALAHIPLGGISGYGEKREPGETKPRQSRESRFWQRRSVSPSARIFVDSARARGYTFPALVNRRVANANASP